MIVKVILTDSDILFSIADGVEIQFQDKSGNDIEMHMLPDSEDFFD